MLESWEVRLWDSSQNYVKVTCIIGVLKRHNYFSMYGLYVTFCL